MGMTLNISRLMCKISGQNPLPNHDALFVLQRTNISNTNMPFLIPPSETNTVSFRQTEYDFMNELRVCAKRANNMRRLAVLCVSLCRLLADIHRRKRYKKNWKLFQKNHARGVKSQVVKALKTSSFRAKSCWEKYKWSLRRSVFDLWEKLKNWSKTAKFY